MLLLVERYTYPHLTCSGLQPSIPVRAHLHSTTCQWTVNRSSRDIDLSSLLQVQEHLCHIHGAEMSNCHSLNHETSSQSPLLAYNKRSWANLTANARQRGHKGIIAVAGWQTGSATVTGSCLWAYRVLDPAQIIKLCETHSYTHT